MGQLFFSTRLDSDRTLCLAPLTERRAKLARTEVADVSGYFLFETLGNGSDAEIEIIAQIETDEAVMRLSELLNLV